MPHGGADGADRGVFERDAEFLLDFCANQRGGIIGRTNEEDLKIDDILLHQAGLVPFIAFYKETIDAATGTPNPAIYAAKPQKGYGVRVAENIYLRDDWRDTMMMRILKSPVGSKNKYVYSDNDFIFLGKGQAIGDQLESGEQIKIPDALPRFIGKIEAKDTLPQNLDTLLFYQRTACFGFCPTFNYTLFNNGAVLYQGIMHVQNPGRFWGLMAEDEWLKLMEKINQINFFKLSSVYPPNERELSCDSNFKVYTLASLPKLVFILSGFILIDNL